MSLAGLKTLDVDRRRADRLRARCHASLRSPTTNLHPPPFDRRWLRHAVAPGMAGAWCLVYLLEVIRRAVVIYGY